MDPAQQQIIDRLKAANNVLVTVSANPTVDQLSACIGLTLLLNKLSKHATAVFSGEVPSTLEFLKPEETIEKNTDSLRDFIIALDKSKADKLRYKVEDKVVKIFITPYRTSISEEDLEFSQGDLNVEVVLALGVHEKDDLDKAIAAHGRILHDATIICINTKFSGGLGSINWVEPQASSLSEMLVQLGEALKEGVLDEQMSTAFLTGIVAETDRFSNTKTTSTTMNISAKLMAAGANPQLVAAQLQNHVQDIPEEKPKDTKPKPEESLELKPSDKNPEEPPQDKTEEPKQETQDNSGALEIDHDEQKPAEADNNQSDKNNPTEAIELPPLVSESSLPETNEENKEADDAIESDDGVSVMVTEPPRLGSAFNASAQSKDEDSNVNPLSEFNMDGPLLTHDDGKTKEPKDEGPKLESGGSPSVSDLLQQVSTATDTPNEPDSADKPADQEQNLLPVEDNPTEEPQAENPSADAPTTDDARAAVEEAMKEAAQASVIPDTPPSAPSSPTGISIDPTTGEVKYQENDAPPTPAVNTPETEVQEDNLPASFAPPPPMPPPIIPPNPSGQGDNTLPPPPQ